MAAWDANTYGQYVAENIAELNRKYTERYEPVEFVVDTAVGSARVQRLIDPAANCICTVAQGADFDVRFSQGKPFHNRISSF